MTAILRRKGKSDTDDGSPGSASPGDASAGGPASASPAAGAAAPALASASDTQPSFRARIDRLVDELGPTAIKHRWKAFERKVGITRAGQAALVGAVLCWVLAYIVAGTAMYLFAYGIVLLLGLSYFLAPRRLKLTGDRTGLFPRAEVGDRFDVQVSLTANRSISTFLLEERVPERLGNTVKVPVTKLAKGAELTHRYGLRCTRRGVYEIGPLVAVASDPLGLSEQETVVAEPFELLVHPRIDVVEDRPLTWSFEDPPVRPPISRPWPAGMEFYGMREYVPGDDTRKIVWRASARTGKVMIRESERGITDRVVIILDTDRGAHSRDGEQVSESFEMGVRAAASLAVRHLRDGFEVHVETNGGPLVRPSRGITQQIPLLDSFSRVDLGRDSLTACLQRMVATAERDAHNILITPRLGPAEAAQLKLLLQTGMSIVVIALLWDEGDSDLMGVAASLGCQVVGVRPDDDLATALYTGLSGAGR